MRALFTVLVVSMTIVSAGILVYWFRGYHGGTFPATERSGREGWKSWDGRHEENSEISRMVLFVVFCWIVLLLLFCAIFIPASTWKMVMKWPVTW